MARSDSTFTPQCFENIAKEQLNPAGTARRSVSNKPRNSFLFLQGVSSPFFARLAQALRAEGQWVKSVSFNMGDILYGKGSRVFYSARPEQLEDFYSQCFMAEGITDLVLFGDRRPVHLPAVALAKRLGVRVHVFEEGYFRPYWVTLERDGVNNHSLLPRDPEWYREVGKHIPRYHNGDAFKLSFASRAFHDVMYHVGGALNKVCFPHYKTHAPFNAAVEYAGYIRQGIRLASAKGRDSSIISEVARNRHRTFLLPLQLDSDAQIRDHSPFKHMKDVLKHVMGSFARHADGDTRLVVKNHPLTPGIVNYDRITRRIAHKLGIADRVDFLESGHMPTLLSHVAGVITVNSTVGGSSLMHNVPTIALSDPIYNLKGLTHQGSLDDFWHTPEPPDTTLFQRFRSTVIHTTQVNGGFYTRCGIDMAVNNSLEVLMAKTSKIERYL
jgi:capsular polysaccharide export protein